MRSEITLIVEHGETTDGLSVFIETLTNTMGHGIRGAEDVVVVSDNMRVDIPLPPAPVSWEKCNKDCSPHTLTDQQWYEANHPEAKHWLSCSIFKIPR